jgi:hypothetical protein
MAEVDVRKGMPPVKLSCDEFELVPRVEPEGMLFGRPLRALR